mmetsp:Transcript_7658/g.17671  ORF Transcript_7658/g.17671 Transcript_7658/m.17671 type:complete len:213 (-) Transcript_7658:8-646(-)
MDSLGNAANSRTIYDINLDQHHIHLYCGRDIQKEALYYFGLELDKVAQGHEADWSQLHALASSLTLKSPAQLALVKRVLCTWINHSFRAFILQYSERSGFRLQRLWVAYIQEQRRCGKSWLKQLKDRIFMVRQFLRLCGFRHDGPDNGRSGPPVRANWLFHDTYKTNANYIAERGFRAYRARDEYYDYKLGQEDAPKVVFFQASESGFVGSL